MSSIFNHSCGPQVYNINVQPPSKGFKLQKPHTICSSHFMSQSIKLYAMPNQMQLPLAVPIPVPHICNSSRDNCTADTLGPHIHLELARHATNEGTLPWADEIHTPIISPYEYLTPLSAGMGYLLSFAHLDAVTFVRCTVYIVIFLLKEFI